MPWWNLLKYFSSPTEDETSQTCDEFPTILDLPPELRYKIWKDFNEAEFKVLREVCRKFYWEVTRLVGAEVVLHGTKPSKNRKNVLNCIFNFETNETRQIQEKLNLMEICPVRSLHLKRLSEIPFKINTMLWSPLRLRRLVFELEEGTPFNDLLEILNCCTNLGCLDVSCTPLQHKEGHSIQLEYIAYEKFAADFTEAIYKSLPGLPALRQLYVSVVKSKSNEEHNFQAMPDEYLSVLDDNKMKEEQKQQLDVLNLTIPTTLRNRALVDWRDFFEGQRNLVELYLKFGYIDSRFFTNVIARNSKTLRTLEICLGDSMYFNWTEVTVTLQKIKFLKITSVYSFIPIHSKGFWEVQMPNLTALELHDIYLDQSDLLHIFNGFPSLRIVNLRHFSSGSFHQSQAPVIFPIIEEALAADRMDKITLIDACVLFYTAEFRQRIEKRHDYYATWPEQNIDSGNFVTFKVMKKGLATSNLN